MKKKNGTERSNKPRYQAQKGNRGLGGHIKVFVGGCTVWWGGGGRASCDPITALISRGRIKVPI